MGALYVNHSRNVAFLLLLFIPDYLLHHNPRTKLQDLVGMYYSGYLKCFAVLCFFPNPHRTIQGVFLVSILNPNFNTSEKHLLNIQHFWEQKYANKYKCSLSKMVSLVFQCHMWMKSDSQSYMKTAAAKLQ